MFVYVDYFLLSQPSVYYFILFPYFCQKDWDWFTKDTISLVLNRFILVLDCLAKGTTIVFF